MLGLSTRKVATALQPVLGRRISPGTVSQVAKMLDGAVEAFHRRPLKDHYPVLMLDGVVLWRKTGLGALRRPVLVALGLHPDGKKEILDYRLATAESAAQWELFLTDLCRRGLEGQNLEMICVDGGSGLLATLPTVYPQVPVQRCWAHKIRNVLNKVKRAAQPPVKASLHAIMNAPTLQKARSHARRFAQRWESSYPAAVKCLRNDLDDWLTCFRYPTVDQRKGRPYHQCHRTPLPRSTSTHKTHGCLSGSYLHGPYPVRRLRSRKQVPRTTYPLPPDTKLLTLPKDFVYN